MENMEKEYALNLVDRYTIIKYAYNLPCTTNLIMVFNEFISKLELDDTEKDQYNITVAGGKVIPSDETYTKIYKSGDFSSIIIDAIRDYVTQLNDQISEYKKSTTYVKGSVIEDIVTVLSKIL